MIERQDDLEELRTGLGRGPVKHRESFDSNVAVLWGDVCRLDPDHLLACTLAVAAEGTWRDGLNFNPLLNPTDRPSGMLG